MTTPALLPYPPRPTFPVWLDDDDMVASILGNWRMDCADVAQANRDALDAMPRVIGYCVSFVTGLPHDCGCGYCAEARAAGLAVGETMEVQA